MEALLQAHRDRKAGETTTYTLVDELLQDLKKGDIGRLVYVVVDKGGHVRTGWSCNTLEALGLLDVGKAQVCEEMNT